MKGYVAYEGHQSLLDIFEDLLNFQCFILKIYSKYNRHFGCTMLLKQCVKKKTKDGMFLRKKPMMMSVDGKGPVFLMKLKLEGESLE